MQTLERIENFSKDVFHALQDKTEYIGEPGVQLMKETIRQPVEKILHPVDTGSDIVKTLRITFERSSEVLNEGFNYIKNGSSTTPQADTEASLEKRQRKAYSKAIRQAVNQALEDPEKGKPGSQNLDDLLKLSQVGPAIIRQLHAAGIYKFSQIANPTKQEKEALSAFENRGALTVWKDESQQFLAQRKQ